MENIHKHIEHDKKIVDDAMASSQSRRQAEEDRDPTPFELYCNDNPDALECRVYDN